MKPLRGCAVKSAPPERFWWGSAEVLVDGVEIVALPSDVGFAVLYEVDTQVGEIACGLHLPQAVESHLRRLVSLGLCEFVAESHLLVLAVEHGYPLVFLSVADDENLFHCFVVLCY